MKTLKRFFRWLTRDWWVPAAHVNGGWYVRHRVKGHTHYTINGQGTLDRRGAVLAASILNTRF
jgi:hypothetical protein